MASDKKILVLFGGPGRERVVLRMCEQGWSPVCVVAPCSTNDRLNKSLDVIRSAGIPVQCTKRAGLDSFLSSFGGATLLSVGFPFLLKPTHLSMFPHCLNVHPTLLPRYRGPTTGAYILMNNEKESGVTIHILDEGMDTGPIVLQRKVPLNRFDTPASLQRKVYDIEPDAVVEALEIFFAPGFTPLPQDECQASTFPAKRVPEDSMIDATKSIGELFDFIRACDIDKYPAFFYVDGHKVCVRFWRPERPSNDQVDML